MVNLFNPYRKDNIAAEQSSNFYGFFLLDHDHVIMVYNKHFISNLSWIISPSPMPTSRKSGVQILLPRSVIFEILNSFRSHIRRWSYQVIPNHISPIHDEDAVSTYYISAVISIGVNDFASGDFFALVIFWELWDVKYF